MKTIITRLKTLITNSKSSSLPYVNFVEAVHPDIGLQDISTSLLPSVFLVPENTSEEWIASQEKQATSIVKAYLVMRYMQRELSIIGDASRSQGEGILDFASDFLSTVRGHRLASEGVDYLDKPLDIESVEYLRDDLSDDVFVLVAVVTMKCTRIFLQTSLPGNV